MKEVKLKRSVVVPIKREDVLLGFLDVDISGVLKIDSQISDETVDEIVNSLTDKFKTLEEFVS
jgi:putative methionine-R-sulfoxide reductase with GAF domain